MCIQHTHFFENTLTHPSPPNCYQKYNVRIIQKNVHDCAHNYPINQIVITHTIVCLQQT